VHDTGNAAGQDAYPRVGFPLWKALQDTLYRARVFPKVVQIESVLRAQTTSLVHSNNVFLSAQPPPIEYSAAAQFHGILDRSCWTRFSHLGPPAPLLCRRHCETFQCKSSKLSPSGLSAGHGWTLPLSGFKCPIEIIGLFPPPLARTRQPLGE
jgi:hypothetical protein